MPELKSWGMVWTEAIPYSAGWRCENSSCTWEVPFGDEAYKYIVGFACEPAYKDVIHLIVGKAIFECPMCFEKFWFHFSDQLVKYAKQWCPNWPK